MKKTVEERVKEVRQARGISQREFAKRIPISQSYLSEIERGTKEINERAIRLVIAEFGISEDWLRTGRGEMFEENISAAVSESIEILKSLDKSFQDGALKMLTGLAAINAANKSA